MRQVALRLLCSEAKVDLSLMRSGYLSKKDLGRVVTVAGSLADALVFIDDTPALNTLEVRAKARRLKKEHNCGLIIIDYLQLMVSSHRGESREKEISEISRSLKALAKELDLPVIALSQLNRKVEDRTDKRPQLADLRESGAIEQDADIILFIYRDEVYNKGDDNPKKGEAEIIVGKQRWIYYLPTDPEAKDFAQERMDGLIQSSDYLKSRIGAINSSRLKMIGRTPIYIKGLRTSRHAKSVPSDGTAFDEVDEHIPEFVASANGQQIYVLSNEKNNFENTPPWQNLNR